MIVYFFVWKCTNVKAFFSRLQIDRDVILIRTCLDFKSEVFIDTNDAELIRMQMQTSKMYITDPGSLFRIHNQLARSLHDYIIAPEWLKSFICLTNLVKLFARNFTGY